MMTTDEKWMLSALQQAEMAAADGEVPVGAVIVRAAARGILLHDVQSVVHQLPVQEVLRSQDRQARHIVEARGGHIVGVTHPNDIGVGKITIDDGIDIRAIPIVSTPNLLIFGSLCHRHHR